MIVRLGYVALSLTVKDSSPNKTTTWKNLQKVDPAYQITKLRLLSKENLKNQLRLLKHNVGEEINVYRFTSKLIPLATHEVAAGWEFEKDLAEDFKEIGDFVKAHHMRVSFHPDHFVNLNSPKEDIVEKSIADLLYHLKQSEAMGLGPSMKFNIHIGGAYQNKEESLKRLLANWEQVPTSIQERITFENDDKTYTAKETLEACKVLKVPMVLDIHHHRCNHEEEALAPLLPEIFATWEGTSLPPKIHASSPRGTESAAAMRSHADLVDGQDLLPFLKLASRYTNELDVMVEAKSKDVALKKLMDDLSQEKEVEKLTEASFRIIKN